MFEKVSITYRGARYEIGRGHDFYGIWAVGGDRSAPLEWWPETPEGWSAAWTKFTGIETPDSIVPVGRRTPPVPRAAQPAGASTAPLGAAALGGASAAPGSPGQGTAVLDQRPVSSGPGYGAYGPSSQGYSPASASTARPSGGFTGPVGPAILLGVGVILGVAGLFPTYLQGASLAQQPAQLVPHAIYLATWTASAVLILLGGTRLRLGALLGAGLTAVTFGLFFADAGTVIADGAHLGGWGLWLSLAGWVVCAAGSILAFRPRSAGMQVSQDWQRTQAGTGRWARMTHRVSQGRPRGAEIGLVVLLVLAGFGVAASFAPSWDSYLLHTTAGQSESFTAGDAFNNPGAVIAGNVAVIVVLALVVIVAAMRRPIRHGAVLLAGAAIPMVAQAISAFIQSGETPSPTQFGLSPAEATQLGLTIDPGLTPAFWIYCGFLVALIVSCAWMLLTPHDGPGRMRTTGAEAGPAAGAGAATGGYTWNPTAPYARNATVVDPPIQAAAPEPRTDTGYPEAEGTDYLSS